MGLSSQTLSITVLHASGLTWTLQRGRTSMDKYVEEARTMTMRSTNSEERQ